MTKDDELKRYNKLRMREEDDCLPGEGIVGRNFRGSPKAVLELINKVLAAMARDSRVQRMIAAEKAEI